MKLRIDDIPTFEGLIEGSPSPDDNMLTEYIRDFQSDICGLVMIKELYSPLKGDEPSEEYNILNECSTRLAHLVSDLKAIKREIHVAKLIGEAGLKTRKGGATQ